ncbi:MAG: DUF5615 family PIN-like protein [Gammaproteobacteria bacterium]|nr:DUF5615 family PIN-like protein [Gammaproteobacteria bacterium]
MGLKFLVDNALSPRLAAGFCAAGHDAVHVRDIGLQSATDIAIFEIAADQSRIIVSEDTDFGTLLALRDAAAPSVVLFRGMLDRRAGSLLHTLVANMASVEADLEAGAVVVFEPSRIRIRRLPMWGARDSGR